jgi:hypothetical protein
VRSKQSKIFLGFLESEVFMIAGEKQQVDSAVTDLQREFNAVLPFILQDEGYKGVSLNIESLYESENVPKLSIHYEEIEKDKLKERRDEIIKVKGRSGIGDYTYDEIISLFSDRDFDIRITRDPNGVKLQVSKGEGE